MTDIVKEEEPIDIDLEEVAPTVGDDVDVEKIEESSEKNFEEDIESSLNSLKQQLEDERKARAEADRLRLEAQQREAEASRRAYESQNEAQSSNLSLINGAIEQVKQANTMLKDRYKQAMQFGDHDAVAEIQFAMSENSAKLMQLEQGKVALESAPRPQQPNAAPRYADPVDEFASHLSPRSADWVRKHPEYARDQRKTQEMISAHQIAVARGHEPDSESYFNTVEGILGLSHSESAREAPQSRQAAPSPAPSSRQASTNGTSTPTRARLSPAEIEAAEMSGMTNQEYARHKIDLQKSGRLN